MEQGIRGYVAGSDSGVNEYKNTPIRITGLAEDAVGKCLKNQCPHLMVWSPVELNHKAAAFACGANKIVRTITRDNIGQCQVETKTTFTGIRSE